MSLIAIAGAKGGCGKSVTTLGLAAAFARVGTPALAVDADRQLPNLHVLAEVDREPTLAAVAEGDDVQATAQRSVRSADVGVLPAAKPAAGIDFAAVADRLEFESIQTLIDCPSGAGPDVVEPLSVADGVIVVSTDTTRSVRGAETTVEMAQRVGVPVLGLILNRCEEVPEGVESRLEVPVLGMVADCEETQGATGSDTASVSPLNDDTCRTQYETIVGRLQAQTSRRRPPGFDAELMETGIAQLDRTLCGGVSPGTVSVLVAEPASQSEQLLYEMTAVRGTLYLTNGRSKTNVQRAIEGASVDTGTPTIRVLGKEGWGKGKSKSGSESEDKNTNESERALEQAETVIQKVPAEATVVIDTVEILERADRRSYRSFLNTLGEQMAETGSIAILHCFAGQRSPKNRPLTKQAADAVFQLESSVPDMDTDGDSDTAIEHALAIRKYRADGSTPKRIGLEFGASKPAVVEPAESSDGE